MKKIALLFLLPLPLYAQIFSKQEISKWQSQANDVTIIRDTWGIPHVYGKTDADAVFGLMYAECEDDFPRVEMNYIEKLGRLSEVQGDSFLYHDLLTRLVLDSAGAVADYQNAPDWLRQLCNAFSDGINFYLYSHPEVKPILLKRFQPWYPLIWTDGSIDPINITDITADELKALYSKDHPLASVSKEGKSLNQQVHPDGYGFQKLRDEEMLDGSNGFAFSPKITESGHAILYINPHVTLYFRTEVQIASDEGLNSYGAVTWGQFFIYQGFNEHCGWMHTSSYVDAADTYIEKISKKGDGYVYDYDGKQKLVTEKKIALKYKQGNTLQTKVITVYYTQHGPIMVNRNGEFLSVRADNRLMSGLEQCWLRNKANSFEDFQKTLDLTGNISNNTVYADAEGNIAYWHGDRIPKRDPHYNWNNPVDGTTSATEWQGYHTIQEIVHCINPPNGWLLNCNSTPFTCAGVNSPKKSDYPDYMAPDPENFRSINAVNVLGSNTNYNLDKVIQAGYDTKLAAFEVLIPSLTQAYDKKISSGDSLYSNLKEAIEILRSWDYRVSENSVATTLAITWGEMILPSIYNTELINDEEGGLVEKSKQFIATASPDQLLQPLHAAINGLSRNYGSWEIAWGTINRFQRISPGIQNQFDDSKPSLPMAFASSTWGMLPSYVSHRYPGTKKRYGVSGNSFICAVEFGKTIRAKSLLAGGESGDLNSKHFFDQGLMYSKGEFKDVLFYKKDVLQHVERSYHPGE